MSVLLCERVGDVAVLTLNRPHVRNALDRALAQALTDAVAAAQDAACIVLTGAGTAFCAGLDLSAAGTDGFLPTDWLARTIGASTVPTVAAVNGAAATGGLELALACDIIVAGQDARFADTHGRLGTVPGGGMITRLTARCGSSFARQMSLTGRWVDATTALRVGLVTDVLPADQLLPHAIELGTAMAQVPRSARQQIKRMYDEATALAPGAGLRHEQAMFDEFVADAPADFTGAHDRLRRSGAV